MALIAIDWSPERPSLRRFGLGFIASGLVLALVLWLVWEHRTVATVLAGASVVLGAWMTLVPVSWAKPVYVALLVPGFLIGNVVSRILVAATFYAVVTPIGVALRVFRSDPLRLARGKESYYHDTTGRHEPPHRSERPF
jgi:hypothetical protein